MIYAYTVTASNPEAILSGKQGKIAISGYYTFPLYGINGELVELLDFTGVHAGYVAVNGIAILPVDELTEEDKKITGLSDVDIKDFEAEIFVTIISVVPVMEEECDCDGDCDSDNCHCK